MAHDQWLVRLDGKSAKPYTLAQLQQLIRSGRVGRLIEVAQDPAGVWRPAGDYEILFPKRAVQPRPPRPPSGLTVPPAPEEPRQADPPPPPSERSESGERRIDDMSVRSAWNERERATWYYAVDGRQVGPVGRSELDRLLRDRGLPGTTLVRDLSMTSWMTASELLGNERPPPVGAGDAARSSPLVYAWFAQRLLAFLIDTAILTGVNLLLVGLALIPILTAPETEAGVIITFQIVCGIIQWLYFAGFESSIRHGTPGKLLMGLQVRRSDGRALGFGVATGRHFGKFLSGLFFGVGFLLPLFDKRSQAMHDQMADCVVVERVPGA